MRKRIVVLVSGSGTNLQAIIDNCEDDTIHGDVVAVISNKDKVMSLQRANQHNIPAHVISHKDYAQRLDFDMALADKINQYSPDLVVLAGFMRILSAQFVDQFLGRMLNIHPSLLPKYPGLHTHQKVLQNKDTKHGATIHFVTAELDGGPAIVQSQIDVSDNDSVDSLSTRVAASEWLIYPLAIKWFCEDALRLLEETVWFSKEIVKNNQFDVKYDDKLTPICTIKIINIQETNNGEEIKN